MERKVYRAPKRIDRNSSAGVQDELDKLLDSGVSSLLIDLTDTEYLSSAGIRVLVATQKRIGRNGSFALSNVRDAVRETLELVGLTEVMTLE